MRKTIKEVYYHTHQVIKKDPELIARISELVSNPDNQNSGKYLCTGLKILAFKSEEDIYLGIDFIKEHVDKFSRILANTYCIDLYSNRRADLSRVLMRIFLDGKHIANLTEDVSENGALKIYNDGCPFGPFIDFNLGHFFKADVMKSVFIVYKEQPRQLESRDRMLKPEPLSIRMPIIDLDHAEMTETFKPLYQESVGKALDELLSAHTLEIS